MARTSRFLGGLLALLVAACSSQELPPPPGGGGPAGAASGGGGHLARGIGGEGPAMGTGGSGNVGPGGGGSGGTGGSGGAVGPGGNTDCLSGDFTCVTSCSDNVPNQLSGSCDHYGALFCPAGFVRLESCAPTACARPATFSCCDQIMGLLMPKPPCGPDGLVGDCPAGTLAAPYYTCVPQSLHVVTSCTELAGQSCDLQAMVCRSHDSLCACEPGDAGLVWLCDDGTGPNP